MLTKDSFSKEYYFAFTVDVEPDIPHRIGTYDGLEYIGDIISLLGELQITGTFLVTGEVASTFPDLVKTIATAGHEIGCHGLRHEPLNGVNPDGLIFPLLKIDDKRDLIERATQAVAVASECQPSSFRAPYLSFDRDTLAILAEIGYTIDSSYWTTVGGKHKGPFSALATTKGTLLEVPVPSGSVNPSSRETGISGFSLRLAGQEAVRQALQFLYATVDVETQHQLVVFTCHPWEYVPYPAWRKMVPEYFWWRSEYLFEETRSFLKFVKQNFNPHFVTLKQLYMYYALNINRLNNG